MIQWKGMIPENRRLSLDADIEEACSRLMGEGWDDSAADVGELQDAYKAALVEIDFLVSRLRECRGARRK